MGKLKIPNVTPIIKDIYGDYYDERGLMCDEYGNIVGPEKLQLRFGEDRGAYDPGIARPVCLLQQAGIDTVQSCEGGKGHSTHEPTIWFRGKKKEAKFVLKMAIELSWPISRVLREWNPVGINGQQSYIEKTWAIEFYKFPNKLGRQFKDHAQLLERDERIIDKIPNQMAKDYGYI